MDHFIILWPWKVQSFTFSISSTVWSSLAPQLSGQKLTHDWSWIFAKIVNKPNPQTLKLSILAENKNQNFKHFQDVFIVCRQQTICLKVSHVRVSFITLPTGFEKGGASTFTISWCLVKFRDRWSCTIESFSSHLRTFTPKSLTFSRAKKLLK